jgi:hypothetical protein
VFPSDELPARGGIAPRKTGFNHGSDSSDMADVLLIPGG